MIEKIKSIKEELGKELELKFKASGMTARELIKITGLNSTRINGVFKGNLDYTITTFLKIVEVLDFQLSLHKNTDDSDK